MAFSHDGLVFSSYGITGDRVGSTFDGAGPSSVDMQIDGAERTHLSVTPFTDRPPSAEEIRAGNRQMQAERCKQAAAEYYMTLGSREALSLRDLQRKYGILHRTSLSRAIGKMKAVKASAGPSVSPQIRLTQDDIVKTDLTQPGTLKGLLRKLHRSYEVVSGQKRRAPGAACTRCQRMKKSCHGFPCSNCFVAGESCIKDEAEKCAVAYNPEPPISHSFWRCEMAPAAKAPDPMRPNLTGWMGLPLFDLGCKADIVKGIMGSCPPKLRSALDRLSRVVTNLIMTQAAKRKPLPEFDESAFVVDSKRVARARFTYEGGSRIAYFSNMVFEFSELHGEEYTSRTMRRDLPLAYTEYRMLCWQLDVLYHSCFNESDSYEHFVPLCYSSFEADRTGRPIPEKWRFQRWTHKLYCGGSQSSAVVVGDEELDHGLAQRSDALGVFCETPFPPSQFFKTPDLKHQEKFSTLVANAAGRKKLDDLADRVVRYFRLDKLPAPPPSHPNCQQLD